MTEARWERGAEGRGEGQKRGALGVVASPRHLPAGPSSWVWDPVFGCSVPGATAPQVPQHAAMRPEEHRDASPSAWSLPVPHRPCPGSIPGSRATFPTPECRGVAPWSILKRIHHSCRRGSCCLVTHGWPEVIKLITRETMNDFEQTESAQRRLGAEHPKSSVKIVEWR